ncbi:hypothetical protein [Streptomyces angustmyceticus]
MGEQVGRVWVVGSVVDYLPLLFLRGAGRPHWDQVLEQGRRI